MSREIPVKLVDDSFVHFTYLSRAHQIISDGELRADSPNKEFAGIAGVQAVSVKHGAHVPGVQYQRLLGRDRDEEVVAIHFKTNTKPKIGYPEEVIWPDNVNLINPKIISQNEAIRMLENNDVDDNDDFVLLYESLITELLDINETNHSGTQRPEHAEG